MTNPTMWRGTPRRSMACIAFGNADSLEVVANAITAGSRTARTNCRSGTLGMTMTAPKTRTMTMARRWYGVMIWVARVIRTPRRRAAAAWAYAAPAPGGAT